MVPVVETNDIRALTNEAWLCNARSQFDVGAALTSALAPSWTVERQVDPFGDLSLIVLPASLDADRLTFVLHEENGLVQVSTFRGDDWNHRQAFRTCQRAVAAIITTAGRTKPPARCRGLGAASAMTAPARR